MKFSIFADLHCCPGRYMGGTDEDLDFIEDRALREGCRFVIHAGDFSHGPSQVPELVERYRRFRLPAYHALGNHDSDMTSYAETLALYGMPDGHYFFDDSGYRFIVCDPNYYRLDGEYIHYDLGNYYAHGPLRDWMPPEQLAWLRESIRTAPGPCVLISHESFERPDGVKNREEVLRIIREANQAKPLSVILCINGHYHRDFLRILDNVIFFDLNSASYDYLANAHDLYPAALCEKFQRLSHSVVYNDPIHAIITLEGTCVTIDGMESSMFLGVRREDTDNPVYDPAGRPSTPVVQSARIALF